MLHWNSREFAKLESNPAGDTEPSARAAAVQAGLPRLLIVEDNDDTRQLLVLALAAENYVLDEAASAGEALDLLRRGRYDLVLTDYDLPGQSGASMLKQAAAEGLLEGAATVMVTAHPQPEGVAAAELIRKPLDLAQFVGQVRHILASMSPPEPPASAEAAGGGPFVELVLYVTAESPASQRARRHLESALAPFDPAQVRLEVCDVSTDPERGEADRVVFTPTLVTRCGGLRNWVLGDLTDRKLLLDLLHVYGVEPKK
jgi:DNA-binding response OmpR family regulator